jgi:hypothetical protein
VKLLKRVISVELLFVIAAVIISSPILTTSTYTFV